MKAVIMAGGEGTRLKAVTGEQPKPMVALLGKPMLEHIIALLARCGFHEICLAVKYRYEDIMQYFGDGADFGVRLRYSIEEESLGTAGAVRNCADFYRKEDFLVISGDCACDGDLKLLAEEHRKSGAAVTVALHRESVPLSYGLAVTDEGGNIRSFIEKPRWSRVVTDLVNTGIYMLSPRVMDYVPEGRAFDFGKELFPLLLEKGEKLVGTELGGYWCDVGSPLSYYRCCVDALEGRLKIEPSPLFSGKKPDEEEKVCDADGTDCPCADRAAVMSVLSEALLDLGADYSDGITLRGRGYLMHIAPREDVSAVRVAVRSKDAEFAKSLTLSAKELIAALGM